VLGGLRRAEELVATIAWPMGARPSLLAQPDSTSGSRKPFDSAKPMAVLQGVAAHSNSKPASMPNQQHGDRWGFEHAMALFDAIKLMRQYQRQHHRCTLIDIGAHHGTVALAALEAGCRVWAFEVKDSYLAVLRRNVAAFNNSISIHTTEPADVVVPAWVRPTLFKCDVDGAELQVLKGARSVLSRSLTVSFELSLIYRRQATGRMGYPLGATAGVARATALAYLRMYRLANFTLYAHWYKPRPRRCGPPTSLPMAEWGTLGAPPPPNGSHPMRALVLSCGRTSSPIEDDAELVDGMLDDDRRPRWVDELDLWGVQRSYCT
jgi:hypothetical protein